MIEMDKTATYRLPIKNGYLDIRVSQDTEYPGLDIEYIDDNEEAENNEERYHTRPRVLIECPADTNKLRALIWSNPGSEDYEESVTFETASDRIRKTA